MAVNADKAVATSFSTVASDATVSGAVLKLVASAMTTLSPLSALSIVVPALEIEVAFTAVVLTGDLTVMASVAAVLLNPVTSSVTVMLKLSAPTVALVSVNVFKAVFTMDKVPFKVKAFVFAPVTVSPVAAVAFKKPLLSLKTAVITVVLVAAVSVIDSPEMVDALLLTMVWVDPGTVISGGFATVMVVLVDEERPVPVSVTAMVRVSDPRVVLVSVNVAKAVLIVASVPESVMDLPEALALAPVALSVPFVSEMVTDRLLLPAAASVIDSPARIVALLI